MTLKEPVGVLSCLKFYCPVALYLLQLETQITIFTRKPTTLQALVQSVLEVGQGCGVLEGVGKPPFVMGLTLPKKW